MATFQKCGDDVYSLAATLINKFETHHPLRDLAVKIDLLFAYPEYDEASGEAKGDALKKNGIKALGIARKLPLKDRVMGRGDAEICLDFEYWDSATDEQQAALLDHELHHLSVKRDERGALYDDHQRPIIELRKHDAEFGWFRIIAERHGKASIERQQARILHDSMGQSFWPDLFGTPALLK